MNTIVGSSQLLITSLQNSDVYNHLITSIQVLETHISWVLLTGDFAYKIKKPVKFGFLDFSTLEKRLFFCQEELRLNRRLAPSLYLGLVPITGTPQHPQMDGAGIPIEYAVKMRQFPSGRLFSGLAERKAIADSELDHLVKKIADFHLSIEKADELSPYGHPQSIKHWFDENFTCIEPLLHEPYQLAELHEIRSWGEAEWQRKSGLFRGRLKQGFVRECHGDLHLGNITLIDGQPVMFDCIEFNPELRWIDVINEMAFLVLDLIHYGLEKQAYRLFNRYLQLTGDYGGIGVLRFYLIYRAMVRAKLALLRGLQKNQDLWQEALNDHQRYVNLALGFIHVSPPSLVITHGFSGSGKSFLAGKLAAQMGAVQIRSDIERKRLFGYREHDKTDGSIYSKEANQQTYEKLCELAKTVITAGYTVIVDAAFLKTWERALFRQLAAECRVRFAILSVTAPEPVLRERIDQRSHDASEATIAVLEMQLHAAEPLMVAELEDAMVIENDQEATETSVAKLETWLQKACDEHK